MDEAGKTVRVRTKGEKGYLTIKGKTTGITRAEFEYEIPLEHALELLTNFCDKTLSKERYTLTFKEKIWEIDVFHGALEGLIVAEIELEDEAEIFEKPEWILDEVSYDPRYYNSQLVNGLKP
jgi:CYTH domain-containing protein